MTQERRGCSRRKALALLLVIPGGAALASIGLVESPLKSYGTNHWHGLVSRWGEPIPLDKSDVQQVSYTYPQSLLNADEVGIIISSQNSNPKGFYQPVTPVLEVNYEDLVPLYITCSMGTIETECWHRPYTRTFDLLSQIAKRRSSNKIPTDCLALYYTDRSGSPLPGSFSIHYKDPPRPRNLQQIMAEDCMAGTIIEADGICISLTVATNCINPLSAPVALGDILLSRHLESRHLTREDITPEKFDEAKSIVGEQLSRLRSIRAYPVHYNKNGSITARADTALREKAA